MSHQPATYGERCFVMLVQFLAVAGFVTFVVTALAIIAPDRMPQ